MNEIDLDSGQNKFAVFEILDVEVTSKEWGLFIQNGAVTLKSLSSLNRSNQSLSFEVSRFLRGQRQRTIAKIGN